MATADKTMTRKFPPPCWTQEEALVLIEVYKERWYLLRRGYLRTADWEYVAQAVSQRCSAASSAKTASQCRHKIEKLRQRFRTERQRALNYSGRFFSTWFYFYSMNAMENGGDDDKSDVIIKQNDDNDGEGLGFNLKRGRLGEYDVCRTNRMLDGRDNVNGNGNGRVEDRGMRNEGSTLPDFRTRKFKDIDVELSRGFDSNEEDGGGGGGRDGGYWTKVASGGMGNRGKFYRSFEGRVRTKEMPPVSEKKRGVKRGRSAVDEMVNSIKLLGEGFVKMERMKMEMAKEIDQMRMEMELKQNELLLESQQQIVDAFVKGLFVKKGKTTVSPQL